MPQEALQPVAVENGMSAKVETAVESDGSILVPKGKANDIKYNIKINDNIAAPVEKGQILGKITYTLGDEVVKEYNICAKSAVAQITFQSAFRLIARYLLKMI